MRVKNKLDSREGEAKCPSKGTVLPPGADQGLVANGSDMVVFFDDGEVHAYSSGAFVMLFDKLPDKDVKK
jgi:hypothetical protein